MKQRIIFRVILSIVFVVVLIGLYPQPSHSEEKVKNTLNGVLFSTIKEKANKTFKSGKKCFIWDSKNTKITVHQIQGQGTIVAVFGISVLASPQTDEIAILSCYRFLANEKETGSLLEFTGSSVPDKTASGKEVRNFGVLINGGDKKTGVEHALSGKATFYVFLADRQDKGEPSYTPISNTIEIKVDLDKLSHGK